jgi:hypothetical protein
MGFPAIPPIGRPWSDLAKVGAIPGALTALNRIKESKPVEKVFLDPQFLDPQKDQVQNEAAKSLQNFETAFDED